MPRKTRRHRGGNLKEMENLRVANRNLQLIEQLKQPKPLSNINNLHGFGKRKHRGGAKAYAYVDRYGSLI